MELNKRGQNGVTCRCGHYLNQHWLKGMFYKDCCVETCECQKARATRVELSPAEVRRQAEVWNRFKASREV